MEREQVSLEGLSGGKPQLGLYLERPSARWDLELIFLDGFVVVLLLRRRLVPVDKLLRSLVDLLFIRHSPHEAPRLGRAFAVRDQ